MNNIFKQENIVDFLQYAGDDTTKCVHNFLLLVSQLNYYDLTVDNT